MFNSLYLQIYIYIIESVMAPRYFCDSKLVYHRQAHLFGGMLITVGRGLSYSQY